MASNCSILKNEPSLAFDVLIDICAVDYLHYGQSEWVTERSTFVGYSRATTQFKNECATDRFVVVYHLLSITHNRRLRVAIPLQLPHLQIDSVIDLWPAADWFEREAYDLFGVVFQGHPDLRRILTDYGFIGHPMRKDFPLCGEVEIRYDAKDERCVYDPVDIQLRTTVAKVIRQHDRGDTNE